MITREEFYEELTSRNAGLVTPAVQKAIRETRVLVAGCGSTGGSAVEPLTRIGVERFTLAEPDGFELNNLNRQAAGVADIGRNKAAVAADRVRQINPHAAVAVVPDGITASNAARLVEDADYVVDGVDVTTRAGWAAKIELHRQAALLRVPVISGYDLGSTQYTRFYRYGTTAPLPFDGDIDLDRERDSTPFALLGRLIPPGFVPKNLIQAIQSTSDTEFTVPQLVDTAGLFGLVAVRVLVRHLSGEVVASEIALDLDRITGENALPPVPDPVVAEWFAAAVR